MKGKIKKTGHKDANIRTLRNVESGVPVELNDGTLLLILLLVSAGFFALLITAASAGAGYDIDAVAASLPQSPGPKTAFETQVTKMVEGKPIEAMMPYIAKRNPETAKYLISIAKHESNWGTYSPKDVAGRTCFNYWGYRGQGEDVTPSGYSCFGSPKEAVSVVGSRLDYLVYGLSLDTPKELIVWKCGRSCSGHSQSDVAQWIRNVDLYSRKVERVAGAEMSR
ncbi:MAG TPA: hypothetical protein VN420_03995 [Candidatus Fimivivens sp.]|nr:hypothetical protein [Candidatus Fimivivens sp.]